MTVRNVEYYKRLMLGFFGLAIIWLVLLTIQGHWAYGLLFAVSMTLGVISLLMWRYENGKQQKGWRHS